MTTLSRPASKLQGQQLLDFVHSNINLPGYEVEQLCGYDNKDEFSAVMAARLFNGEYTDSDGEPTMDVDMLERIQFTTDATESECVDIARTLRDDYNIDSM